MTESKSMPKFKTGALLIGMSLALGACGPVNRGLESVNQPVVQRTDYVFDINAATLGPVDEQNLAAWFNALRLGYGDSVSIDDRTGYGAARAAIATIVARYGLLLTDTAPVTQGSDGFGGVRVVVSRSTAHVPGCPNWDRPSTPELAGSTMSNFGCAINSNLAAMVANPADLVQGQSGPGTDPMTINRAIKTYRDAQPTGTGGLKEEKTGGSDSSGGN